jgi:CysZ protein
MSIFRGIKDNLRDNTDLTPARQLVPFRERFRSLRRSLLFHLGFGLLFMIPVLNILFLSFAPVGATLYHIDQENGSKVQGLSISDFEFGIWD